MSSLFALFQQVDVLDGELWLEDGKLKYSFPKGAIPKEFLEELKASKPFIMRYLQLEEILKKEGWLMLSRLEAYEFSLTERHTMYLFREGNDLWTVWRGNWGIDEKTKRLISEPSKEKTVKSNVSFLEAIHEANKYVGWYKRKVLKQLWIAPDIGYESPAKE
jgi:sugar-specific transcriptional regulator TrmB